MCMSRKSRGAHQDETEKSVRMAQPLWRRQQKKIKQVQFLETRLDIESTFTALTKTMTAAFITIKKLPGNVDADSMDMDMSGQVRSLCEQGRLREALHILHLMDRPIPCTYGQLFQSCINMKSLAQGKLVHAHIIQRASELDIYVQTKLLIMYAKCGNIRDIRRVLDEMQEPNVVSWTAIIGAYAKHGLCQEAFMLFVEMQRAGVQPDQFTFATVLQVCAHLPDIVLGKTVHDNIVRSGFQFHVFLGNALVDMYVKCGRIEDARKVFDKLPERNVVTSNAMIAGYARNGLLDEAVKLFHGIPERNVISWTTVIAAYASHGCSEEALAMFCEMQRAGIQGNHITFASVLPAFADLGTLEYGKEIHENIVRCGCQSNVFVGSALVDMYVKCWSTEDARKVIDRMPEKNVITWNAMIAGYAQNANVDEALKLFENMPEKNIVSWTSVISGYVKNGHFHEAMELFRKMHLTGVKPNSVTYASILPACGNLAALGYGKGFHNDIVKSGFQSDVFVGNGLVDMYSKCGRIEYALKVFEEMPSRNVVSWTAMIVSYAVHGFGKEALQLFEEMQQCGMKPNHVTFVGVLSACCNAGLIDDGWRYFDCMTRDYNITPTMKHYCCMVDLLGRAGHLDEARDFITKMPIKPDAALWGSLLSACRIHNNMELGEHVAEQLFNSEPDNPAHYVLLSNIYAAAGKWDDVQNVRRLMKERKVERMPGCSWIEVNNQVHVFRVADKSHSQTPEIYAELEILFGQIKEAGYVPNINFVLHDVDEEQKERFVVHHSEKLAIAFGLLNTSPGIPIRIVKNLRVCADCHSAIRFISKIVAREIVVRDANRFHHFRSGWCSCGDYW